ncbi:hypothetical protein Tco_1266201 [Tanacetum coccineum]
MVTLVEKRSSNKFCDFHNDKGHSTDECMQLKKQIEELVRAGKLSHLIKEIKQGRDQTKNGKKEAPAKDKSLAIYMIQPWQRTTKQKLTQSFAYGSEITFPPLANSDGTEGPLVIEAEIGGHMIHRMYIDGDHCTKAWMDFMIVRSISPYNGIIGRPGIREIQAVPSTAHGMLKFPADGGIHLRFPPALSTSLLLLLRCALFAGARSSLAVVAHLRVAPHPEPAAAFLCHTHSGPFILPSFLSFSLRAWRPCGPSLPAWPSSSIGPLEKESGAGEGAYAIPTTHNPHPPSSLSLRGPSLQSPSSLYAC